VGIRLNNTEGFSTVEFILAGVIILIVLVVGWLVLNSNNSPSKIILSKQKHIDSVVSKINQNNYETLANQLYHGGYITKSLYNTTESLISSYNNNSLASNSAYSTMICVSYIPNKFSYSKVQLNSSSSANLGVNVYIPYISTPTKYSADWVLNGSWQLNSVSC
jgi:hypothetical protein